MMVMKLIHKMCCIFCRGDILYYMFLLFCYLLFVLGHTCQGNSFRINLGECNITKCWKMNVYQQEISKVGSNDNITEVSLQIKGNTFFQIQTMWRIAF